MKQVSYWGATYIRCHRRKFSLFSDVAPGIYAPLVINLKLSGFRIPDLSFFKGVPGHTAQVVLPTSWKPIWGFSRIYLRSL